MNATKEHLIAAKRNYKLATRLYQAVASVNPTGQSSLDALIALQNALPEGMRVLDDFERGRNRNWSLKAGYQIFDRAIAAQDDAKPDDGSEDGGDWMNGDFT